MMSIERDSPLFGTPSGCCCAAASLWAKNEAAIKRIENVAINRLSFFIPLLSVFYPQPLAVTRDKKGHPT